MPSSCSSRAGPDDDRRAAGSDHRSTIPSRMSSHGCKLSRSSLSARTQGAHWASRLSRAVPGVSSPMSPASASSCASGLAMRHSARAVGQHAVLAAVGLRSGAGADPAPDPNSRESPLPQDPSSVASRWTWSRQTGAWSASATGGDPAGECRALAPVNRARHTYAATPAGTSRPGVTMRAGPADALVSPAGRHAHRCPATLAARERVALPSPRLRLRSHVLAPPPRPVQRLPAARVRRIPPPGVRTGPIPLTCVPARRRRAGMPPPTGVA